MSAMDGERPAFGATGVGAELRSAREGLGWDLASLSATLRIRLPYLEALEAGRVGDMPGAAYALGFLRTYATCLGLDAEALSRRFRSEAGELNRKTELEFPAPVPERGIPTGAVMLLGVVIAFGAYVGWYYSSGDQHTPVETVPAVPDRLAPFAHKDDAGTTSPQVASILPSTSPPSPQLAPPPRSIAPSQAGAMTVPPAPVPAPAPAPVASAEPPPAPVIPAAPDGRMVLRAKSDAWMQVRVNHGPVLLNRVLHAGESWNVPGDKTDLLLTTGNAAGTEIVVDGNLAPAMSGGSIVRRDIQLDPDRVKAGRYASLAPPAPPKPKPKPVVVQPAPGDAGASGDGSAPE